MGLLSAIFEPLRDQLANGSVAVILGGGVLSFFVLAIVLNVLSQLIFRNPTEPPVVFHWLPFIGSTITYGIDPYHFFFDCRRKVGLRSGCRIWLCFRLTTVIVRRCVYFYTAWKENYRVLGEERKRVDTQWEIKGRECGGNLQSPYHSRFWLGRGIRLS